MSKQGLGKSQIIVCRVQNDTHTYLDKVLEIFFESLRCMRYFQSIDLVVKRSESESKSAFFAVNNAIFMIAAISWLKLFGSKKEGTHYMKIFTKKSMNNDFKDSFDLFGISNVNDLESELLKEIKMSSKSFSDYVNGMKKCRDMLYAHTDLRIFRVPRDAGEWRSQKNMRPEKHPDYTLARDSLFWFYRLITDLLKHVMSETGNYKFKIYTPETIMEMIEDECANIRRSIQL